jgi:hypothetical protein
LRFGRKDETRTVLENGKAAALRPMRPPHRFTTLTAWQSR